MKIEMRLLAFMLSNEILQYTDVSFTLSEKLSQ